MESDNNHNPEKKITTKSVINLWFLSLSSKIRNYFFTGVIVLIPIGFTLYLSKFIINVSSKVLPSYFNPNSYLAFSIPGLEIIITIVFITFVGGLSLSFLGKKFLKVIDRLFKQIPLLGTFWSAIQQMSQSFKQNKHKNKNVVLIEYPRKGIWAVGFATKENEGEIANKVQKRLLNVFVPTTPNPTSGFLLMIPIEDIIYLDMSFEEASKFIVSAGTTST
tara:strand:- start:84 stop:743 length:660 start_codon:yes stop_codon:yes gene_type:complete